MIFWNNLLPLLFNCWNSIARIQHYVASAPLVNLIIPSTIYWLRSVSLSYFTLLTSLYCRSIFITPLITAFSPWNQQLSSEEEKKKRRRKRRMYPTTLPRVVRSGPLRREGVIENSRGKREKEKRKRKRKCTTPLHTLLFFTLLYFTLLYFTLLSTLSNACTFVPNICAPKKQVTNRWAKYS